MKKNVVFTALLCALTMVFALSLGSCSDGDDGGSSGGSATTALSGKSYRGNNDTNSTSGILTFAASGNTVTSVSVDSRGKTTTETGTYTMSGTTVIVTLEKGGAFALTYNSGNDTLYYPAYGFTMTKV